MSNRFNLKPAPRLENRVSQPLDLAACDETGEYAHLKGWVVVVDLDVDLKANDLIASAQDDSLSFRERNAAIAEWIEKVVVAWNFVNNETGEPLPQPREGGSFLCPQSLFAPMTAAVTKALQPKKA